MTKRIALGKEWAWRTDDSNTWNVMTTEKFMQFPLEVAAAVTGRRTVIQAGGHCGLYPYQYADLFERVITFEPEETNLACLLENVKEKKNVEVNNCALGETSTQTSLENFATNTGQYRINNNNTGSVVVSRIDDFDIKDVDLIHLDVEGYELFALKGGIETILKSKPDIVLETNDLCTEYNYTIVELETWLRSIGYYRTNRLKKRKHDRMYSYQPEYILP
jgi:FkbM family methyltransferase